MMTLTLSLRNFPGGGLKAWLRVFVMKTPSYNR